STMLHLVAGLDEPAAGDVRVFGRALAHLDETELAAFRAREPALVFQSRNLWPGLSVLEHVAAALRLGGRGRGDDAGAHALAACRGVAVSYGEGEAAVRALDGVDLSIDEGESLALLGRSGSGKTTLLHLLGGLVEPTAGSVEWRGKPLSTLDAAARGALRAH